MNLIYSIPTRKKEEVTKSKYLFSGGHNIHIFVKYNNELLNYHISHMSPSGQKLCNGCLQCYHTQHPL